MAVILKPVGSGVWVERVQLVSASSHPPGRLLVAGVLLLVHSHMILGLLDPLTHAGQSTRQFIRPSKIAVPEEEIEDGEAN